MRTPIYQKIRRYMNEQDISRKQVAISMNISESKLSLILSGQRRLTVDEYLDMCTAMAVPPQKFFND